MTLSQIYLAQALLSNDGLEGAQDALLPVFSIPDEQRLPQIVQTLNRLRVQLRSKSYSGLPVARDLNEAICSIGWIDCRTIQRADLGGDHGLIIGQVQRVWFSPEFLNSEGIPHTQTSPLMQVTGNRFTTAAQTSQISYYNRDP